MKKYFILAGALLLSGCSMWNSWSWDSLNPWAGENEEEEEVVVQPSQQTTLPENVNKYLWQASLDKLDFMGIAEKNSEEGRIVTDWNVLPAAPNERFKFEVKIDGGELRADALDVKAYKEVKSKNGWVKTLPSSSFENEVGQAIITRAKTLYIQDQDKE